MEYKKLVVNDIELCRFSEPIEVMNDKFLFEIYREGETILLINGEPVSIVWHDNGPSSGHYYALQGIKKNKEIEGKLEDFEFLVQDKLPEDFDLLNLFEVFRPLLKSGIYRIFYSYPYKYKVNKGFSTTRISRSFALCMTAIKNTARPSLYLHEGVIMFTQSIETIDENRVKYYEEQILKGKSPIIVTLGMPPKEDTDDIFSQFGDSYPQFIVDGHHKALAYTNLNKKMLGSKLPVEVFVPGIFHIIKIPYKGVNNRLSEKNRQEILSKMLTNKEVSEIMDFYND